MGTTLLAMPRLIIKVVSRCPKGLSWAPACQIETFSACQVSRGPTVIAWVGTSEMLPPPEVRAFWANVTGCSSTTRVPNWRNSAGVGEHRDRRPSVSRDH